MLNYILDYDNTNGHINLKIENISVYCVTAILHWWFNVIALLIINTLHLVILLPDKFDKN